MDGLANGVGVEVEKGSVDKVEWAMVLRTIDRDPVGFESTAVGVECLGWHPLAYYVELGGKDDCGSHPRW